MKNIYSIFIIILLILCSIFCYSDDTPILVVSTIYPISDWVKNVGQEKVSSTVLLPPNASPHTYEPEPGDIKQVAKANVFVRVGLGLEIWSDKIIKASGNKNLKVLTLSDGIKVINIDEDNHHNDDQDSHDHHHSGVNPHIWLDPIIAIKCIDKITDSLSGVDVSNKEYYQKNAEKYKKALLAFDKKTRESLQNIKNPNYVSFHNAFTYFAKQYNLNEVAVLAKFPGKEPSPKYMKHLTELIREKNVRALFAEPQLSDKLMKILSVETGIKILRLDPLGSPYVTGRSDYLSLMEYNVRTIKEAFE